MIIMFVVKEFQVKVFKNLSVYKRNCLDTDQARNSLPCTMYKNLPLVSTKR